MGMADLGGKKEEEGTVVVKWSIGLRVRLGVLYCCCGCALNGQRRCFCTCLGSALFFNSTGCTLSRRDDSAMTRFASHAAVTSARLPKLADHPLTAAAYARLAGGVGGVRRGIA
jgi:hypothetical protein